MKHMIPDVQPAVKKETVRVAVYTVTGVILMWIGFAILHFIRPDQVPLDYRVFLAGIIGGFIAVLNFFLMGLTVQQIAASNDEDMSRMKMKSSYSQRMMLQMLWVVAAIAFPCFNMVAGMIPLLFPSLGIKLTGIFRK